MRPKLGGRALRFSATQDINIDRIGFSWQARFPLVGLVAMTVVDAYSDGEGRLEARILGLPLQRQTGPETTSGEVLRYLAECAVGALCDGREP